MNRKRLLLVALVACLGLMITNPARGAAPKAQNIVFSSGASGGTFYVLMATMMEYLPKDIPGLNITGFEGAATQNLRMLAQNDAQMATVWCDQFHDATTGTGIFKNEKLEGLTAMQTCSKAMQFFMSRSKLPLETAEDFKKVKGIIFSPGEVGSGLATACEEIFKEMGFSLKEFEANGNQIVYAAYGQFAEMLADNQLDAFFVSGGLDTPHNAILQAELKTDLKIIPTEGPWVKTLCERLPSMAPHTMAANVYKNQTEPKEVMVYYTMIAARADMDEELAYQITKSNYKNIGKWNESVPQTKKIFQKDTDFVMGFDHKLLHPGAARFWKEIDAIQ